MAPFSGEKDHLGLQRLEAHGIGVGPLEAGCCAPPELVDHVAEVGTLHNPRDIVGGGVTALAWTLAE